MLLLPFSAYSTTTFTAIPCFRYSLLTSQYNTCRERSNEVCTKRDFSPLFFSLEETLTLRAFVAYTFYYNKNWRIEEEELVRREVFKLTIWWIFMFLNQIASILKDLREFYSPFIFEMHLYSWWNSFRQMPEKLLLRSTMRRILQLSCKIRVTMAKYSITQIRISFKKSRYKFVNTLYNKTIQLNSLWQFTQLLSKKFWSRENFYIL